MLRSYDTRTQLPANWKQDVSRLFAQEGHCIYKGRNEIRTMQINGQTIVLKKYGRPPIFNHFLYSLGLRTPKALRSYKNAQAILACGFDTPRPLGYEIRYQEGWMTDSYFISTCAEGISVAEGFQAGGAAADELLQAFARYTAELHMHGLMHRDYILNNVFFVQRDGEYHFSLIDINRFVLQKRPIGWLLVCINLMQPFSDDARLRKFVAAYARARGVNENKLVWWVLRSRHIRNRYSRLKELLRKLPGARYFSPRAKQNGDAK